jgi:hypothetical protein
MLCSTVNDTVSNSQYLATNDSMMVTKALEGMCVETVLTLVAISRNLPGMTEKNL